FLRVSAGVQLVAFFGTLAAYFLKPPLLLPFTGKSVGGSWEPSFWFYALFLQGSGAAPPFLKFYAIRALWTTLALAVAAAIAYTLAFRRCVRRVIEQPDLPAAGSFAGARLGRFLVDRMLAAPLDRAIFLFTARTLVRSRQHRLLLA